MLVSHIEPRGIAPLADGGHEPNSYKGNTDCREMFHVKTAIQPSFSGAG